MIRQSQCSSSSTVTSYVYDTNAKLSKLLVKNTDGVYTKYVYGNGLIAEETNGQFKTYHFDYRGSKVAITDSQGNVTERFKYNTYGKVIEHTGNSDVIFKYNGRDGVVTEPNGLYYMRARYYSPDLMRFINADILAGSIADTLTISRYAYANCNPVSNIDPFGLSAERGNLGPTELEAAYMAKHIYSATEKDYFKDLGEGFGGWWLIDIINNFEGMKIGVYVKTIGDTTCYTLVSKGSSTTSDWVNNFQQPFGISDDMSDSIREAKAFVRQHSDSHITFVGHSKGGAEAIANAVATNKNAIVFNPATPALSSYGLSTKNYTADMTTYTVKGEVLSVLLGTFSEPINNGVYLQHPHGDLAPGDWIDKHSMDSVIELLEYKLWEDLK